MPKKKKIPTAEEIFEKVVSASVALSELDNVVTEFERAGGREMMSGNAAWLPFLETIDLLNENSGYLSGHVATLFPDVVAASEAAFDASRDE